jgi:hypothetical protein
MNSISVSITDERESVNKALRSSSSQCCHHVQAFYSCVVCCENTLGEQCGPELDLHVFEETTLLWKMD